MNTQRNEEPPFDVQCPHSVVPDIECDECYPEPFKEGWTESD
jgi:hypothetical protein